MTQGALRGVNLGGWLVLEKWMTPGLFAGTDAIDEYTLLQTKDGMAKVRRHHETFITEDDFRWLAENGLNAVRIPVGYWVLEGNDPYIAAASRLDWAMEMAAKYGIKVLICLHGAPGSQNGRDHSGQVGRARWYDDIKYREKTIEALERIARRYADAPALWGIELLNEPKFGILQLRLRWFYRQAHKRLRQILRAETKIVFHDGFTPRLLSGALWPSRAAVMDIHWYHFGDWLYRWRRLGWYFFKLRTRKLLVWWLQRWQPVIIGEWSLVIADKTLPKYPRSQEWNLVRRHGELQLELYETTAGWFYWTYKTEARGIWHFRSMVEDGVIKLPPR